MSIFSASAFSFLESCLATVPSRSDDASIADWFALRTHQGAVRMDNQDRVLVARWSKAGQGVWVVAVADGIGGGKAGAEAASTALAAFVSALLENEDAPPKQRLVIAARGANETVAGKWAGKEGSTLSAVLVTAGPCVWLNVGDSRIYGINRQWEVQPLTRDDVLPSGGGLIQFIGIGEGLVPHTDEIPPAITRVLLTSDGAHQYVASLLPFLVRTAQANDSMLVDRLTHLSLWCGGDDNTTCAAALLSSHACRTNQPVLDVWTPGLHHRLALGPNMTEAASQRKKSRSRKKLPADAPRLEQGAIDVAPPADTHRAESAKEHPVRKRRPDITMSFEAGQATPSQSEIPEEKQP